jgi:hypothetical protein
MQWGTINRGCEGSARAELTSHLTVGIGDLTSIIWQCNKKAFSKWEESHL